MTEGVDEPYYCPICGQAWDLKYCFGCSYEYQKGAEVREVPVRYNWVQSIGIGVGFFLWILLLIIVTFPEQFLGLFK